MGAPERIWVLPWERDADDGIVWDAGDWWVVPEPTEPGYAEIADTVEYVRADIHEAALTTARREALEEAAALAEDFDWVLPYFDNLEMDEATDSDLAKWE